MKPRPTILIVGAGNVAWHLCKAFSQAKFELVGIANRSKEKLNSFSTEFGIETFGMHELPQTSLAILAISDASIPSVSKLVNSKAVVHTSGTVDVQEVETANRGVFYPFQTFTKGVNLDYHRVPIFTELSNALTNEYLTYLAQAFNPTTYPLSSENRKALHLSGVVANNFVNALLGEAIKLLERHNIPTNVLWPLINETVRKAEAIGTVKSQTGPAIRNDIKTMNEHLEYLKTDDILKKLYGLLSSMVQERNS